MNYKNTIMGLLVLVLLMAMSLGCNRQESVPLEVENPFFEAVENVYGNLNAVQVKGEILYKQYCSLCHGESGDGKGMNAYNLDPRPPDLAGTLKTKGNEYIIRVITGGTKAVGKSALCPPYGRVIREEEMKYIVSYLLNKFSVMPGSP